MRHFALQYQGKNNENTNNERGDKFTDHNGNVVGYSVDKKANGDGFGFSTLASVQIPPPTPTAECKQYRPDSPLGRQIFSMFECFGSART